MAACFRRAKLALNALRNNTRCFTSTPIPKSPIPHPSSFRHSGYSSISSTNTGFSQRPGISSSKCPYNNPFLNGAKKRFYYVDRHQVEHFRPRGPQRWFQNPRTVLIVALVGSGVGVTVYFGNLETVPYTKRKHLVLLSKEMEKQMGESQFKQMMAGFKGKILPPIHPDSVKVRLIAKEIIEALKRGLSHDRVWSDLGYASPDSSFGLESGNGKETVAALSEGRELEVAWSREDEILDDKWIQKSRKQSHSGQLKPSTSHLDGLNWEVVVVNDPMVNAFCLPGGKIVVFTGLLEHFKTDAELATIIGHEVGHAVARHIAEGITKNLWFAILSLVLYQFITPDVVNTMSTLLLRLPFSRKMEIEADYIGLLLMASAGYDPRVAPSVFEKLGKVGGDTALRDYLSTHPSGKKRAQLLAQAQVMEEALTIYKNVRAGHGVEGFL